MQHVSEAMIKSVAKTSRIFDPKVFGLSVNLKREIQITYRLMHHPSGIRLQSWHMTRRAIGAEEETLWLIAM